MGRFSSLEIADGVSEPDIVTSAACRLVSDDSESDVEPAAAPGISVLLLLTKLKVSAVVEDDRVGGWVAQKVVVLLLVVVPVEDPPLVPLEQLESL